MRTHRARRRTLTAVITALALLTVLLLPAVVHRADAALECSLTLDENRCPEWADAYQGGQGGNRPFAVEASPAGDRIYIVGWVKGEANPYDVDFETFAYDTATGQRVWTSRFRGHLDSEDWPRDLAVSPDGARVCVTGMSWNGMPTPLTGMDYATACYNASSGEQQWVAMYNGKGVPAYPGVPAYDQAAAIAFSPDGERVYVTGQAYEAGNSWDFSTISYVAATGQQDWVATLDDGTFGDDRAVDMVVGPDGRIYVSGYGKSKNGTDSDYITVAYDDDREAHKAIEAWSVFWDGGTRHWDFASKMTIAADGSAVFITGFGDNAPAATGRWQYGTVAYDSSNGDLLWSDRFRGPSEFANIPYGITASPDGAKVFVVGFTDRASTATPVATVNNPYTDMTTVAYDASSGVRAWVATFGSATDIEVGMAVAVAPDSSRVYAVGYAWTQASLVGFSDIATVAYGTADGEELWVGRFNSSNPGIASDFGYGAVATASHVYVVGTLQPQRFGTLAYAL